MANSSDLYNQIQDVQSQLKPLLSNQSGVGDYFTNQLNQAMDYNKPALQNAAKIQSSLYSLPGSLMDQYNKDFGGTTGVDSSTRINNILSRIGSQTGLANTASGLATQAGTNIKDLASKLTDQYNTKITGLQSQLSPLLSMWDEMYSQEQQNARSAASNSGSSLDQSIIDYLLNNQDSSDPTSTTTSTPTNIINNMITSAKSNRGSMTSDDFNSAYKTIMDYANNNGVTINGEGLWQALGNTSSNGGTTSLYNTAPTTDLASQYGLK